MKKKITDAWLKAFIAGEQRAFSYIYKYFYNEISYFCRKFSINSQEAEDVAIKTFRKLFRDHYKYRNQEQIRAFLYKTAYRASLDVLKSGYHSKTSLTDFSLDEICNFQNEESIMEDLERERIEAYVLNDLLTAVESLPRQPRIVFKLYYQGRTTAQISQRLCISEDTVRQHKHRAIEILRQDWRNKWNGNSVDWIIVLVFLYGLW